MISPAQDLARELAELPDPDAALEEILASLTIVQLAALRYDWLNFWARPKQIFPNTPWRSMGFLTGRAFGKTRAISEWVTLEVMAGRAKRIGLAAQNEDKTWEVMVEGKSGLLATSPPWFKARVENDTVKWPNGAQAFVYTPHEPQNVHGPEHDLFWFSEVSKWPAATREEFLQDARRGLRLGYGRAVWDSSPRRKHPELRKLLAKVEQYPTVHLVVRGSMRENVDNLTDEFVDEQIAEFEGTQAGREQIDGEFLDDDQGALFKQEWLDKRAPAPARWVRRILSVDPAIGTREDSDKTGMAELGLGPDGRAYVLADDSGKHTPDEWADLALDRYVDSKLDCIVAETNRGGQLVTRNLRAAAKERQLRVVVLAAGDTPRHTPGVVNVREVNARGEKAERAAPVATAYEKGRVVHVEGADLTDLEILMTTWEPPPPGARSRRSPDALDAVVHGVNELLGLGVETKQDRSGEIRAAQAAAKVVKQSPQGPIAVLGPSRPRARWGRTL